MVLRLSSNALLRCTRALVGGARCLWYRLLGVKIGGGVCLGRIKIPRNFHDIRILRGALIDDYAVFIVSGDPSPEAKITIGADCHVGRFSLIDASVRIVIGERTTVGPHVYITDHNHGTRADKLVGEQPLVSAPTTIGREVSLGAGVKVMKGVTIGDGCVVGAGSVVTRDLPSGCYATGVPAKVVRDPADPLSGERETSPAP